MGQIFCSLVLLVSFVFPQDANQATKRQPPAKEALLVGDSVLANIANYNDAMQLLAAQHPFIFKAVVCQRLITYGCKKTARQSSLDILKDNSGKFSKVVVVATGYNDYDNSSFSKAIAEVSTEASRQGVLILWLTYREQGTVQKKAISFNIQLRKFAQVVPNLRILDWNEISFNHDSWFAKDKIHTSHIGSLEMAKAISDILAGF